QKHQHDEGRGNRDSAVLPPPAPPLPLRMVPRGLRSFGAEDANFFLDLLPGPRGRDGLPESLEFWKRRLDGSATDEPCRVGVIYGPSGCGKSSFVKAGLLPRLSSAVFTLYVEASADGTEERLLKLLRQKCAELPPDLGLVDSLAYLRRREGPKVLI